MKLLLTEICLQTIEKQLRSCKYLSNQFTESSNRGYKGLLLLSKTP